MTTAASSLSIVEIIQHYQRSIERCQDDKTRLLHCIHKLYKLPIKVEHLQATGIGKTVNSLRKFSGEIGLAAKVLVTKWKAMVAAEEEPIETSAVKHGNRMPQQAPSNDKTSSDDDDDALDNTDDKTAVNYVKPKHSSSKSSLKSREKDKDKHSQSQRTARESESHNRNATAKEHRREQSSAPSKHHLSSSRRRKSKSHDSEKASSHHHKSRDSERDKHDQKRKERRKETESTDDTGKKNTAAASSSSSGHREKSHGSSDQDCSKSRQKHSRHGGHEKTTDHQAREKENKHRANSKEPRRPSTSKDKEGHNDAKISKDVKRDHGKSDSKNKEDRRDKRKSSSSKSSPSCSGSAKPTAVVMPQIHSARSSTSPTRLQQKRPYDGENTCSKDEPSPSAKAKVRKLTSSVDGGNNDRDEGIDSSMGANFADVLGMLNKPTKKTRKTLPNAKSATASSSSSSSKPATTVVNDHPKPISRSSLPQSKIAKVLPPVRTNPDEKPELLLSAAKLAPLDPSIALALPTISTNYRPMPLNQTVMDCVFNSGQPTALLSTPRTPARCFTDAEALHHGISSKTMRTKIYSGVKTGQIHQVASLFALCIRVLQKNIDALEYTGGVPFELLRPVLENATPQQLLVFEEFNPYLMEDSDDLWRIHCKRNHRMQQRQEMESWREMFLRCQDYLERKLSTLAESIKQSQKDIAAPVRKTQLAFVDSMVKPPRNIQRKQEQFGTKAKLVATPASRVASLSSVTPNAVQTGDARLRVAASVRDPAQIGSSHMRPKKAPLMAKALQLMRGRQNR